MSASVRVGSAAIALLVLIGAAAGCYSPSISEGTLACAEGGKRCPDGFVCRDDKLCYRSYAGDAPADQPVDAMQMDVPDAAELDVRDAAELDVRDAAQLDTRDAAELDVRDAAQPDVRDAAPETPTGGDAGPDAPGGNGGLGTACTAAAQCASGICVDGVCCNETCAERCMACDVAPSRGTCTQVTSGQPRGARTACAGAGAMCGGACSSASATACTFPGDAVTCRAASCSGATSTARAGCNGAGVCPAATTASCGDFACNATGTACLVTCTSDNQCATAARPYCDAGACVSGRPNGARCQIAGECASSRCVDGYCCNDACGASCQACDVAGHLGTCWPVATGTPYGGRAPCGGTNPCAGYCNNQPSGQCFFPGSATSCPCPLVTGSCDGMGACRTLGTLCL